MVADPGAQCLPANCPRRRLYETFPPEFRIWVGNMTDLYDRMQAGFLVRNDDLSLEEWRAVARIKQFYETKRLAQTAGLDGRLG